MKKTQLIEEVAGEFAELKRTMFRAVSRQIDPSVPPAQGELLFLVAKQHTLSVKEVASHMQISSGAVTQLVDGLVGYGLIERQQDDKDRRVVHIVLSNKGRDQVAQLRHDYLHSFESVMGTLDNVELITLRDIIKKVNKTVTKEG